MAVPTIFLTRCHAGPDEDADEEDGNANEEDGDADEEGDCNQ